MRFFGLFTNQFSDMGLFLFFLVLGFWMVMSDTDFLIWVSEPPLYNLLYVNYVYLLLVCSDIAIAKL